MRPRITLQIMAAVHLGAAFAGAQAQPPTAGVVGYVLSVRGAWLVGSRADAAASGRALNAGEMVRAGPAPWRDHEIVIVLRDGGAVRYRCADAPEAHPVPEAWNCARPIGLTARARGALHARVLDAVMNHFGAHATRPTSLVSRGILDRDLREAVTLLLDGALDVRDALSALPAGEYELTLAPIQVDGAAVKRLAEPATARLAWDPTAPRLLGSPGLRPGLYELGMVGSSDVAWILVCAGPKCASTRAEFQEVRDLTAQWRGQVAAPDTRAFVRAALDLLSRRDPGA